MQILSIPELQAILEPHLPTFSRIIWPVFETYERIPSDVRINFKVITQATVIHSLLAAQAQVEFHDVDGVTVMPGPNESLYVCFEGLELGIDGAAICQFKKLDNENRSNNLRTFRQKQMRANDQLAGMPNGATYVDAGYVLNDMGTVIRTVPLVRLVDQKLIFEVPKQKGGLGLVSPPSGNNPLPGFDVVTERFKIHRRTEKDVIGNDGPGE